VRTQANGHGSCRRVDRPVLPCTAAEMPTERLLSIICGFSFVCYSTTAACTAPSCACTDGSVEISLGCHASRQVWRCRGGVAGETGQVAWTKRRHRLDRHSFYMLLVPGRGCTTHYTPNMAKVRGRGQVQPGQHKHCRACLVPVFSGEATPSTVVVYLS
jgi:hypothetical protein